MPRPKRIEYEGAWYHVMNRGASKKSIFHSYDDRDYFLKLLGQVNDQWNLQAHAYCLMTNHYHLLVHTPNLGLSESMRHLSSMYTMRYNKKYKRDGALFRGRFKSILLDRDDCASAILRYIHQNPVKAGLCKKVESYRWSSHRAYLNEKNKPSFLYTDEILKDFAKSSSKARRKLHEFVIGRESKYFINSIEGPRPLSVMGSQGFRDWIKDNYLDKVKKDKLISTARSNKRPEIKPKQMLSYVSSEFSVSKKSIMENKSGSIANIPRLTYLYLLHKMAGFTHNEISEIIKSGNKASVAQNIYRFSRRLEEDEELGERIKGMKGNLLSNVKA
ncbi:MAG: transposase [Pseudomonadota bacterium]